MVSGRDDVVADDHLSLSAGFPAFLSGRGHQISGVYREADDNLRRASHALIIFFQHPRRCRDVGASPGQGRRRWSIHVAAPAKSLRIHLATPATGLILALFNLLPFYANEVNFIMSISRGWGVAGGRRNTSGRRRAGVVRRRPGVEPAYYPGRTGVLRRHTQTMPIFYISTCAARRKPR